MKLVKTENYNCEYLEENFNNTNEVKEEKIFLNELKKLYKNQVNKHKETIFSVTKLIMDFIKREMKSKVICLKTEKGVNDTIFVTLTLSLTSKEIQKILALNLPSINFDNIIDEVLLEIEKECKNQGLEFENICSDSKSIKILANLTDE